MNRISIVLFDMNGVIVNDEDLHKQAFKKVLKDQEILLTSKQYIDYFIGRTDKDGFIDFLNEIGRSVDEYLLKRLLLEKGKAYQELTRDNLKPYPGVIDFIKDLFDHGLGLGMVTSSTRLETETVLSVLEINQFFTGLVTADDIEIGKPNPEGYLKGAALFNSQADNCLVIEDARSGIKAAKKANMNVLAVTNTHSRKDLATADFVFNSLNENTLTELKTLINI